MNSDYVSSSTFVGGNVHTNPGPLNISHWDPCQSGFIEGDSCANQLLAITHEIHKNFDANSSIDTIGFLNITTAFDKVWHHGLICKLQSYGIQSELLKVPENYLHNRRKEMF